MECLVGHGSRLSVGGGASGVETRRGSSAVAANKEYVVAVGGGRRRNKNCGVGVSSVSWRDLLLSLHSVVFSNCRTCKVQTNPHYLHDCSLQLSSNDLERLTPAAGTDSEAVLRRAPWLWSLHYFLLFSISILLSSKCLVMIRKNIMQHVFLSSISACLLWAPMFSFRRRFLICNRIEESCLAAMSTMTEMLK